MKNTNNILKLANFYNYAVSQVIDILNAGRAIDAIAFKFDNFTNKYNFTEKQKKQVAYKIIKMGQDKFNKLVAPYLKMEPINLNINFNIPGQGEITALYAIPLYLHDLIHETSLPGSIKKFEIKNKENSPYSLEELIEEQTVTAISLNLPGLSQLGIYIENTLSSIINNFDFNDEFATEVENLEDKSFELNFDEYQKIKNKIKHLEQQKIPIYTSMLERLLQEFFDKLKNDIENISNVKYKNMAEKFLKFLRQKYKSIDVSSEKFFPIEKHDFFKDVTVRLKSHLQNSAKEFEDRFFSRKTNLSDPNNSSNEIFREKRYEQKQEGPIADLTDDFKMSLIRRWVLAVDQETDNILEQSRQLSFDF